MPNSRVCLCFDVFMAANACVVTVQLSATCHRSICRSTQAKLFSVSICLCWHQQFKRSFDYLCWSAWKKQLLRCSSRSTWNVQSEKSERVCLLCKLPITNSAGASAVEVQSHRWLPKSSGGLKRDTETHSAAVVSQLFPITWEFTLSTDTSICTCFGIAFS